MIMAWIVQRRAPWLPLLRCPATTAGVVFDGDLVLVEPTSLPVDDIGPAAGTWFGRLDGDSKRRCVCARPLRASPTKNGRGGSLEQTTRDGAILFEPVLKDLPRIDYFIASSIEVRSAVAITHPIRPDLSSQVLPIRGSCPTSIILWTTGTAGFEFPYLVTGGRDGVEGLDQRGALDV